MSLGSGPSLGPPPPAASLLTEENTSIPCHCSLHPEVIYINIPMLSLQRGEIGDKVDMEALTFLLEKEL